MKNEYEKQHTFSQLDHILMLAKWPPETFRLQSSPKLYASKWWRFFSYIRYKITFIRVSFLPFAFTSMDCYRCHGLVKYVFRKNIPVWFSNQNKIILYKLCFGELSMNITHWCIFIGVFILFDTLYHSSLIRSPVK